MKSAAAEGVLVLEGRTTCPAPAPCAPVTVTALWVQIAPSGSQQLLTLIPRSGWLSAAPVPGHRSQRGLGACRAGSPQRSLSEPPAFGLVLERHNLFSQSRAPCCCSWHMLVTHNTRAVLVFAVRFA